MTCWTLHKSFQSYPDYRYSSWKWYMCESCTVPPVHVDYIRQYAAQLEYIRRMYSHLPPWLNCVRSCFISGLSLICQTLEKPPWGGQIGLVIVLLAHGGAAFPPSQCCTCIEHGFVIQAFTASHYLTANVPKATEALVDAIWCRCRIVLNKCKICKITITRFYIYFSLSSNFKD